MLTEYQKYHLKNTCRTIDDGVDFFVYFNNYDFVFGGDGRCDMAQGNVFFVDVYTNQQGYNILMNIIQLSNVCHINSKSLNEFKLYLN